ncbi:hypothetical protein HDV00_006263 [Rhizophlyctis rosea]|nr:hypothetical protein HDV00_006263 [Rhizophlyctis rosea]
MTMQLYPGGHGTSPFGRKALIVAHELSLMPQITLQLEAVGVTKTALTLTNHNPLSKVPTLVLEDETPLFDSKVICEYFNDLAGGSLYPDAKSGKRWDALRRQAQADGIMEAATIVFVETRVRPEGRMWEEWVAKQWGKVTLALDRFEKEAEEGKLAPPEEMTIGEISVAVALGFVGWFAQLAPERDWKEGRPALVKWFAGYEGRPSFVETAPPV